MVTQITNGVKVSVKTSFEGAFNRFNSLYYAFTYLISIENLSDAPIQINTRYWEIKDSLYDSRTIEADGIVGEQPILQPNETHEYRSGYVMASTIGAMKGYYTATNLETNTSFNVTIPNFKLITNFTLN